MAKPYCVESPTPPGGQSPEPLDRRQRTSRIVAGTVCLAIAGGLGYLATLRLPLLLWPVAGVAAWFGFTHVLAGFIAYSGCPEIGAVPTWLLRRHIHIACKPWDWMDQKIRNR